MNLPLGSELMATHEGAFHLPDENRDVRGSVRLNFLGNHTITSDTDVTVSRTLDVLASTGIEAHGVRHRLWAGRSPTR